MVRAASGEQIDLTWTQVQSCRKRHLLRNVVDGTVRVVGVKRSDLVIDRRRTDAEFFFPWEWTISRKKRSRKRRGNSRTEEADQ